MKANFRQQGWLAWPLVICIGWMLLCERPAFGDRNCYACGNCHIAIDELTCTSTEGASVSSGCNYAVTLNECRNSFRAQLIFGTDYPGNLNCQSQPATASSLWTISPEGGLTITNVGEGAAVVFPTVSLNSVEEGTRTLTTIVNDVPYTARVTVTIDDGRNGCSSCSAADATTMGDTTTGVGSAVASFNLGRIAFGKRVGALQIHEKFATTALSTPKCLKFPYLTNGSCCVVTNASGIRQVKAPEGLADVVTNSIYKYFINFYSPSQISGTNPDGTYQTVGGPLSTLTVENPDTTGATTNRLKVTDGDGRVSEFETTATGWKVMKGGGIYQEEKASTWSDGFTIRTSTREIRNETNGLVLYLVNKQRVFAFGERMIERAVGSGADARTNSYFWYTNGPAYTDGLLHQVRLAEGNWEIYEYETNALKTNIYLAFLNQAPTSNGSLARQIVYEYGTNAIPGAGDKAKLRRNEPRKVVEYALGHEVARRYRVVSFDEVRDYQAVTPGASWTNADNLVTITRLYAVTNDPNRGRVQSIEYPDGTMEIFEYSMPSNRTDTVWKGAPGTGKTNIVDGTKTITVKGPVGQMISRTVIDVASSITNSHELYSNYDAYNRPRKVTYLDGTFSWTDYGCCGPITETNREGTVITYYQDPLKRPAATTKNSITVTNYFDGAGNLLRSVRIGSDASKITNGLKTYNTGRRITSSKDALGNETTYSESINNFQLTRTTTYPDGGTRVEEYYRDGQLAKVTGTAVYGVRYERGVEQDGSVWRLYTKEIKLDASGNDTSEWTKTYSDMVGRPYKTVYADATAREQSYNSKGQLTKEIDPDGVTTLYSYNSRGQLEITAIDINRNGTIDYAGTDRIQQHAQSITSNNGFNVIQTRIYRWATNNLAVSNLIVTLETTVEGLRTWKKSFGLTNQSQTAYMGSGTRYQTNTAPDGSFTVSQYQHEQLLSVTRKDSAGNQLSKTSYGYDAHGRLQTAADARNGTTTYAYDNADRRISDTTPLPGTGQNAQKTSFAYDFAGRLIQTTLPDGGVIYHAHSLRGELLTNYGARIYSVSYAYDHRGRKTNMVTWTNFVNRSGSAITTWKYDGLRGFMTNKVYADGNGPTFTYTPAGKVRTRKWARGTTTTYNTNAADDIISVTYSDGTSNIIYNLDRLGRRTNIIDGAGSRFLSYAESGQLLLETNASGPLSKMSTSYGYDALRRQTTISIRSNTATVFTHSYTWDSVSRLTNVSDGTYNAAYEYVANSPLVSQISFRSNSAVRMTTTKKYDYLSRLREISSVPSASSPVRFAYQYNDANQRILRTDSDASYWSYDYDSLGQVISGKHSWDDATPVAGQQFEYAYDDIGNRVRTKEGGNASGTGLRTATYAVNTLNQYTQRDVPGAADVIGIAHPSASVTVNGQTTYRRGEYYHKELSINNASAVVWQPVTNRAIYGGQTNTEIGNFLLPKTPQTFWYDSDGNTLSDVVWTNTWNGENRLAAAENTTAVPTASRAKEAWTFDSEGRWVQRIVYSWSGSAYAAQSTNRFLWDGKVLLAMLNRTNGLVMSFLRGVDVGGASASQDASVGSVLAVNIVTNGVHFCAYDGNGNVDALISARDGTISATYEFDPFGKIQRISGPVAKANPIRFGSQFEDEVLATVKYVYRDQQPALGRWLSRDPAEERGGANLATFVSNDPVNNVEFLGLWKTVQACSSVEAQTLNSAENAAQTIAQQTLGLLSDGTYATIPLFKQGYPKLFNVTDIGAAAGYKPEESFNTWHDDLHQALTAIDRAIKDKEIIAICAPRCGDAECDRGFAAYTSSQSDSITFCPTFFKATAKSQAGVVLHEYSHVKFGTIDNFRSLDYALDWGKFPKSADFYNALATFGPEPWFKAFYGIVYGHALNYKYIPE
jgi:RHS repeat-associated protein